MAALEDYNGQTPAWCPGCGNFPILNALKQALVDLQIEPHQFTIVSGIGQGAKLPHYIKCNTFNGLHGRFLPVATGIRLANSNMLVICIAGDGDCYGEGGNHFLHAIRRNINVKLFVHNNQIYGLTKGQASPTTSEGTLTKTQPFGSLSQAFNPIAMAVALDCSFVARGFAADMEFLKELMKAAINHEGFALLDILQPCVTFNLVNTYKWYKDRVYRLEKDYDPYNKLDAFNKALQWQDRIPTGVIFRNDRPTAESHIPIIKDTPLVRQEFSVSAVEKELNAFY
ncbi:pyruvate ferredoxin/flavodoxin oxidoreductase subunit beta [Candidatus Magnetoovum chiemensis]|nr:pyruvate ferredoxin/flavodoxin oxidoreductase subunit beta [Candidatus Magnetoovum chiemensis]